MTCLDKDITDWSKIKTAVKDALGDYRMETYQEKSYDPSDHYGGIRRHG